MQSSNSIMVWYVQKCLLPQRRIVLNVQMYRANYLMIDRFMKLESYNKFVLKSFCSQMLCSIMCLIAVAILELQILLHSALISREMCV